MNAFQYYNPTKILFGQGKTALINKYIPSQAKVLITYGGGSIFENGAYQQVVDALKGYHFTEFGGIEANPQYDTLMKAVEIVKTKNIDFILAVGGGSVLDGTKFIAAAALFEGDNPWDICQKQAKVCRAVPLASIMTLPATGSEMNQGAVISRKETKEKYAFHSPFVFPQFSVLDPSFTQTLPARQRANGVVDSFVHVMEQYLTYPVNAPLQDRMAEAVLNTLIELGKQYVEHPEDLETAGSVMWSATVALNSWLSCGVPQDWATHMIGHEITAQFNIDHARTLAIVLPGVMQIMKKEKREKLLQYAERIWKIDLTDEDQKIEESIRLTETFFHSMGVSTRLKDYQLNESDAFSIVNGLKNKGFDSLGEKGLITPEKIMDILSVYGF